MSLTQLPTSMYSFDSGSIAFRNRVINGDMRIDQRNAGASYAVPTGTTSYPVCDRWHFTKDPSGMTLTVQQTSTAPVGFTKSMVSTATVGVVPTSVQFVCIQQKIEGNNCVDLGFGTSAATNVTASFWVRSSATGTYAFALKNSDNTRSYVATYSIAAIDTWEYKTITIPGDTSGTWLKDSGIGIRVHFDLGSGTGYNTTAGAWQSGDYNRTTGTSNWSQTTGNTFYITGVQLEKGTTATPFEFRPYGTELALCQRYCQMYSSTEAGNNARYGFGEAYTSTGFSCVMPLFQKMRVTPDLASTAGFVSSFAVASRNTNTACTSVTLYADGSTPSIASLAVSVASGLTAGSAGALVSNNNKNTYLLYTAEL